ncbi:hypothetical protein D3C76_403770 [compost metagenome]
MNRIQHRAKKMRRIRREFFRAKYGKTVGDFLDMQESLRRWETRKAAEEAYLNEQFMQDFRKRNF